MPYHIIIPARYASTRLPGKPLLPLADKPILQHVHEQACKSQAASVCIATDDDRIRTAAEMFGADVCMTSAEHTSGTERLAEVIDIKKFKEDDIIINLQGDEPFMPSQCLDQVASLLADKANCSMASLCEPISEPTDVFDPNIVKVVMDKNRYALYFSRAPIPWNRETFIEGETTRPLSGSEYYRHIGLYAYRAGFIKTYLTLEPGPLERLESLEQLRVLWHGYKIAMDAATQSPGPGIDTTEDLARAERFIAEYSTQ